jgi:hypothetical protein
LCGELAGIRTQDPRLKRALLYLLSYELTGKSRYFKTNIKVTMSGRARLHPMHGQTGAVAAPRDKDAEKACRLLLELSGRFPQNGLYMKEEQKRYRQA